MLQEQSAFSQQGESGGPLWISNGTSALAVGLVEGTSCGTAVDVKLTSDITDEIDKFLTSKVACYRRGTRIATQQGGVAIEELAVGHLIVTASGAVRPIVWIGHRGIDSLGQPDPLVVQPVRVLAGAFGDGLPHRDLWPSPGHNVAREGRLIPISALINGRSVAQVEQDHVEYWHVELDAHDILLAEGLPAESYLDCGNRTAFANGGTLAMRIPILRRNIGPRLACHWSKRVPRSL